MDSPSSMLAGEAFLERVFAAYRTATSEHGPNLWNTPRLIGWDEPGGTYLGRGLAPALFAKAHELGVELPPDLAVPGAVLPPERIVGILRQVAAHFFPLLGDQRSRPTGP